MRAEPRQPGLLHRLAQPPQKVAIVRASRIGDFLCATPAFRALRQALPQAELTLIGLPFVADLVARSQHLDRFVAFPGFPGMAEQFFAARQTTQVLQSLQAEAFDLAIQLHGSGVYSNPFTLMLGARYTAGFIREGDSPGRLDAALPLPTTGHEIQRTLALMTFLGAPDQGEQTEFPLWAVDHQAAEALLAHFPRPLIGLHPAARHPSKCWPIDRFIAVGRMLQAECGGTIVLLGDRESTALIESIAQALGSIAVNLAGKTTLSELGAVIDRLSLLITNDSGPAHIAYALGIPTVTIFGSTAPERWGAEATDHPSQYRSLVTKLPCHPCDEGVCPIEYQCLAQITITQVLTAVRSLVHQ